MKKIKWILVLFAILIAMPTHADTLDLEENTNKIKFEDIERLILRQNPTIQINKNTEENLLDSIDAIRDARYDERDLENAIDGLRNAVNGTNQAIAQQDILINNLKQMLTFENNMPGQGSNPIPGQNPNLEQESDPGQNPAPDSTYQSLIGAQIATLEYIKVLYKSNLSTLEQNIDAMEKQVREFDKLPAKEMELDKAILQIEMGNKSIVWGAQNLYLAHSSLKRQRDELLQNLELLDNQINIMKLQEELGMITLLDLNGVINQRDQIILGITTLDIQISNLKRELNIMLGLSYYEDLNLEDTFIIDKTIISAINYEDDLKIATKNSYSIQIKKLDYDIQYNNMRWADRYGSSDEFRAARRSLESTEIAIDAEYKVVESTLIKAYQELQNKVAVLDNENKNLEYEGQKYDALKLKYELGMISKIELNQAESEYYSKYNKAKTAEQNLFQMFLQYQAFLRGMDFMQ